MSLANGRHYLAIPGPSVMPDRVLQAMHRAAPNIYTGALVDMTATLVPDLCAVARTKGKVAIYIANGHGVWEAALSNVLNPGDTALVLATGRFALGWSEIGDRIRIRSQIIDFGQRSPIDLDRVAEALAADKAHKIKAVMAVHVDTATSARNDIAGLRKVLDATGHPAILMVDCIASLACDRFEMDGWGVDVMVAACQKGLMTPPGMGFVFFNDKADQLRENCTNVTHYWDWRPRATPSEFYQYWDGTGPTHHLYGLRAALDMIAEEGLEHVWRRHEVLAQTYWAALEAWSADGPIEVNIADRSHRSNAVTAVRLAAPNGTALRDWMTEKAGVTLGIGLGMAPPGDPAWHGFFRIGHMGHVNAHMVLGTIGAMEAGLKALDIPHGKGGLDAAVTVCAGA